MSSRLALLLAPLLGIGVLPGCDADPPAPDRLQVVELTTKPFLLTYTSDDAMKPNLLTHRNRYRFRVDWIEDGRRQKVTSEFLTTGSVIFQDGPYADRFSLEAVEGKRVEGAPGEDPQWLMIATIADRKTNQLLEVTKGSRNALVQRDHTAILRFPRSENSAALLTVHQGAAFSIPFDQENPERLYRFATVDAEDRVVIEWSENQETRQLALAPPAE